MDLVQNAQLLRVDLPQNRSFVSEDAVSTCPLLTPSPPTNALVDPITDPQQPSYIVPSDMLVTKLKQVEDEPNAGDSTSSRSSDTAEPACVQLLNHHHYHHLSKNSEDGVIQENGIKAPSFQLACNKTSQDFFFVDWNWPIIRKSCMWVFMSAIFACVGLVVAMVATLPRTCNPPVQWYQGGLMYEVFTASFQDSNADGIGDLRGIKQRLDYIESLGVRGVRLNSIFSTQNYPENYNNVTSLIQIEQSLGTLNDFAVLITEMHSRNISLILDFPLWPYIKHLSPTERIYRQNRTLNEYLMASDYIDDVTDVISDAIDFWLQQGVDGFYLKGLEHYVNNEHFGTSLRKWKLQIGSDRALIISHEVFEISPERYIQIILNRVDLIDVKLDVETGTEAIRQQIESIQNGTLFSKPGTPWVHWTLGNVESKRLASRLSYGNVTLGATLLQLMLPGTPSIFYGDEIGLQDILDKDGDRKDVKHMHQLAAMAWDKPGKQFTNRDVLPWMHGSPTHSNFAQRRLIAQMTKLRDNSPAIYVNSIMKDDVNKANAEVKYAAGDILVIQRWYPRRNSYVIVSNLGAEMFNADLSRMFYSGRILVGPRAESAIETISFKDVFLWPGESVVIELH